MKLGVVGEDHPAERARPAAGEAGAVTRVVLFSMVLAAGVALLLAYAPVGSFGAVHHLVPAPVAAALLVILFATVDLFPLSVRVRGQVSLVVLSEIPLLLGLVTVPPRTLVLCKLLGEVLVFGFIRRQAPHKLAFNLSSGAMAAVLAAMVYRAALGSHSAIGPFSWVAGVGALATAAVFAHVAVSIVRRLYHQTAQRQYASETMVSALVLVASIALAFVVLDAAWWNSWAIVPLALVGALIVFAYRGYLRLTDRFGALEQLYDFSRSVGATSLETAGTGWKILEQVQAVMRTRRADLVMLDTTAAVQHLGSDGSHRWTTCTPSLDDRSVLASVVTQAESVIWDGRPATKSQPTYTDPVLGEFRDAIAVPLESGERVIGALVALDRDEGFECFDDDDVRLFEALAAHATTSLERARLVEELRLEAESKSHQANHDSLTGLPNRTLFLDRASAALAETGRAAVALFDLDRFKDVNDTLGHPTGDRLLCQVAERLVSAASRRGTVARLGGDEFAVVVPGVIGPEEAAGIVRDLVAAIVQPVDVDGIPLALTVSAGVSIGPDHGDNVVTLLQRADIAMYRAKERHSGIELYSAAYDQSMQRTLLLGGQLSRALSSGRQLRIVYQPIASLATGEIIRAEALTRWFHPELGEIPADEFITIAEQMGLIHKITALVLREACSQVAEWRRSGFSIDVAVNLSSRDLAEPSLVAMVAENLSTSCLPPQCLSLEVTETAVMSDIVEASAVLAQLGHLGVRIAVDDYGSGYSSLAYLHRLPLNELKLDRSFVGSIVTDQSHAIIVRSSIAMAHSLGLSVVAEGAEDESTCALLAEAGCDAIQGYALSPPLPPDDFYRWMSALPRQRAERLPQVKQLRVIEGRQQDPA